VAGRRRLRPEACSKKVPACCCTDRHEDELLEPLATLTTLYRRLDPDELEDADKLLAEIETLPLPETLVEAVEDLVLSVLLMADMSRPRRAAARRALTRPARSVRRGRPDRAEHPSNMLSPDQAAPVSNVVVGPQTGPAVLPGAVFGHHVHHAAALAEQPLDNPVVEGLRHHHAAGRYSPVSAVG